MTIFYISLKGYCYKCYKNGTRKRIKKIQVGGNNICKELDEYTDTYILKKDSIVYSGNTSINIINKFKFTTYLPIFHLYILHSLPHILLMYDSYKHTIHN